jgi:hypothetical protein
MPEQPYVTATRADGGIALTVYPHEGDTVRVVLSPRRAALLGSDLLGLALEPLFQARAEDPGRARRPAGNSAGGCNPPALKEYAYP